MPYFRKKHIQVAFEKHIQAGCEKKNPLRLDGCLSKSHLMTMNIFLFSILFYRSYRSLYIFPFVFQKFVDRDQNMLFTVFHPIYYYRRLQICLFLYSALFILQMFVDREMLIPKQCPIYITIVSGSGYGYFCIQYPICITDVCELGSTYANYFILSYLYYRRSWIGIC